METLKDVIETAGGVAIAASATGLTERAVYKWFARDALPRSEYTGETTYCAAIAKASNGKVTKAQILSAGRPKPATT